MSLPSLSWLSRVGEAASVLIPGVGTAVGFIVMIYDLGESMICGGLNYLIQHVSAMDTSAFSNGSFALVASIGYGNAVFPLTEAVNIGLALAGACTTIALIRWIKSVVPTISN